MQLNVTRRLSSSLDSQRGLSLVEIMMAFTLFVVVASATYVALLQSVKQSDHAYEDYLAIVALRDLSAEMQETANRDNDLTNKEGIASVYSRYHGKKFGAVNLSGATITVTCYADEGEVPNVLGGPQDLNFDNDAEDFLSNVSEGTDLLVVPTELTIDYGETGSTRSLTIHRLITKTSD